MIARNRASVFVLASVAGALTLAASAGDAAPRGNGLVINELMASNSKVITDPQGEALAALNTLVTEMEDRYHRMRAVGARNIVGFNKIVKTKKKGSYPKFEGKWAPMPYVVLIIDEMADMMMVLGKEAERPITRLAQKARACGIHLVIATQRTVIDHGLQDFRFDLVDRLFQWNIFWR